MGGGLLAEALQTYSASTVWVRASAACGAFVAGAWAEVTEVSLIFLVAPEADKRLSTGLRAGGPGPQCVAGEFLRISP